MRVGVVTTWKIPCGVGKYTEQLCNELLDKVELKIFAEKTSNELEPLDPNKNIPYERCYVRGESYSELLQKISDYNPDIVHIQFETSMFQETYSYHSSFLDFLNALHAKNIKTVVTFHTIIPRPNFNNEETHQVTMWYNSLNSKGIVGNDAVKNELLKWAPNFDVSTIPLGSTIFNSISKEEAAEKLKLDKNRIYIVQPGFFGADKGMTQLVNLMPQILYKYPNACLVFAGGLHPMAPEAWRAHTKECIIEIIKSKLTKNVIMLGRFVPEEELNLWLGLADIIMQNYHWVSGLYSASANAHRLLCANRPIIMNAQDVRLSEFTNDVHCAKAIDNNMLEVILKCLENKDFAKQISEGAVRYAHETTFESAAKKHIELYEKCI